MHLKQLRWLLVVVALTFCSTAKADTVYVNGSYAFASNGYGIPPYGGTLDGQSESFYCVDFTHDITGGMSWNVNITSMSASSFSATFLDNQTTYEEMAWLVTNMMSTSSQTQQAEDQYAIWSLTGGPNPFGTDATLIAEALAAVDGGFTGQGFEILTPTGSTGQEFLVYVPEPGETILLLIGMIFLGIATRKRLFSVAQTL
jgi:hypothetical protein